MSNLTELSIRVLSEEHLSDLLKLQEDVINGLENTDILRQNTIEMLLSCLKEPNYSLGVFDKDLLVAVGVLYFPLDETENLAIYLDGVDINGLKTANYKLCMVREEYRGNSLQYRLGLMLEDVAKQRGVDILCATVSPINPPSIKNTLKLGYKLNKTLEKYGFKRNLYYKIIK